ncbi:MAG: MFS transporter, partial [Porticoccaceae bacterium]|nr:MFS transporter [Porticoccaceae bacterium]
MSTASNLSSISKSPFDSWRTIVISLYMTLVGYGVLVGIPVIST